ncbi:MAG: DUF4388 domain-containing protein [Deltaproteobacteria bacterium]|nr:DUF4388 domain-containing protein [Deltaproteobacteria bacterium]
MQNIIDVLAQEEWNWNSCNVSPHKTALENKKAMNQNRGLQQNRTNSFVRETLPISLSAKLNEGQKDEKSSPTFSARVHREGLEISDNLHNFKFDSLEKAVQHSLKQGNSIQRQSAVKVGTAPIFTLQNRVPEAAHESDTDRIDRLIRSVRLTLFSGELSEADLVVRKLLGTSYFTSKQNASAFQTDLSDLCQYVNDLLQGESGKSAAFCASNDVSTDMDDSIRWATHVWQCRFWISQGKLKEAEQAGKSAYYLSSRFDSVSRGATHCLIAEMYMMAGKVSEALNIIKPSKNIAQRHGFKLLLGALELTESQIYFNDRKFAQAEASACLALERIPNSIYPRLLLGRIALLDDKISRAKKIYEEILAMDPGHPDALIDLDILSAIQSARFDRESVFPYFESRESAPTRSRIRIMKNALSREPDLQPLRNLLVWRLASLGDFTTSQLLHHPSSEETTKYQYKPNIIVGYGTSVILNSGYVNIDTYMETVSRDSNVGLQAKPVSERAELTDTRLSLPPEEILRIVKSDMASKLFSGELNAFSLADLLEFLRNGRRTGSLLCSSEKGVGAIELKDGFICSAIVPDIDNIGTLLLERGKITAEKLAEGIEAQEKDISGAKLGAILAKRGFVDAESVREAIVAQTFSAIRNMLDWTCGRFVFSPAALTGTQPVCVDIRLDVQFVLMELYRKIDEENRPKLQPLE